METPKTDAVIYKAGHLVPDREVVFADFARDLERENAKMRAAIDALRERFLFRSSGDALAVLRVIEAAQ